MQTLSHMRRSRFDLQPLVILALFGAALVYESLTTIIPWLSPLLGVGFLYWRRHYHEKNHYLQIGLFFLYTLYFEIDHDMLLFSFILWALFYHYFVAEYVEKGLNCQMCTLMMQLFYLYIGYYLFNLFLAFLFNIPLPPFSETYIVYMVTDFVLMVLFL